MAGHLASVVGMEFRTPQGQERYDALVAVAPEVLVGLDFDGTLSPIVEDPARAVIHPDGPRVLAALAARVRAVVVVTGRPARQVVELGGLDRSRTRSPDGARLVVMGQYGNERWDAASREFTSPEPPRRARRRSATSCPGCSRVRTPTAPTWRRRGSRSPCTRGGCPTRARRSRGWRRRWPTRPSGTGCPWSRAGWCSRSGRRGCTRASRCEAAVEEHQAGGVLFAGDDLGDLEAFEAVRATARPGDAGAAGVLGLGGAGGARASSPTSWSTGPAGVLGLLDALRRSGRLSPAPRPRR